MNSADFISEEPVKCRRDTRAIASMLPREKKHPQPMYGSKSGCYSQARVDGQGYNISWEEDSKPVFGHGLPVKYSEGHRLDVYKRQPPMMAKLPLTLSTPILACLIFFFIIL